MSKIIYSVLIHLLLFSCKVFGASLFSPFADPVIVNDVSFVNLGTYRKSYKLIKTIGLKLKIM